MQSTANLNDRRLQYNDELTAFNERVRPAYADVCMDLWDAFFKPLERAVNYFSRRNTESFIAAFEAAESRKQSK